MLRRWFGYISVVYVQVLAQVRPTCVVQLHYSQQLELTPALLYITEQKV